MEEIMTSTSTATQRARPHAGAAWVVLSLVCACQFMVILDAAIVNVALPSIQRDLGFTATGLAWVVNGYLLTFAGFMLLGGRAADLFGYRRMLTTGLFLFSASSLAGGLATASEILVAARVVQGIGAAIMAPATLAVINTRFTEEHARARAFGAWSASGGVGGMAGAVVGGAITTGLSWRWVFLINVPIGAVLIVVAVMSLAGTRTGQRESLDLAGAVTGTAGLAALIYGVMQSADHGWPSMLVVAPTVVGLLLLVVFTVVEARLATRPMMPLRLFSIRRVAVGTGMLLLFGGIAIAMWYFTSLFLQNVLGYSALRAGLGQTPAEVTFVVIARSAAALLPRTGVRRLVLARSSPRRQQLRHQRARAHTAHRGRHRADLPHPHGSGDRRRPRRRRGDHRRPGHHRQSGRRIDRPGGTRDGRQREGSDEDRREFPGRRPRRRLRPGLPHGRRTRPGHRGGQRAAAMAPLRGRCTHESVRSRHTPDSRVTLAD